MIALEELRMVYRIWSEKERGERRKGREERGERREGKEERKEG